MMLAENGACFVLFCTLLALAKCDFNPFSDSVLYNLKWSGPQESQEEQGDVSSQQYAEEDDFVDMVTNNNEKYRCTIASDDQLKGRPTIYTGPSEDDLLQPLYTQTTCSYRIESYWTYELCHGKYLRQYHEEKETGKQISIQEYYLGYRKDTSTSKPTEPIHTGAVTTIKKVKTKKVDGMQMAYYQVNMTDGTPCDLNREPRKTSVLYVCHPQGRGELYELKESSSCEYEVVVLTSALCTHPDYKSKQPHKNDISCHSLENSPRRPKSIDVIELENTPGAYNQQKYKSTGHSTILPSGGKNVQEEPSETVWDASKGKHGTEVGSLADKQLLQDFLAGQYCLQGGMGWWKHEFCFGQHVKQYHDEKNSGRTDIILGIWDEKIHMKWLEEHQSKRPKPKGLRTQISQFYSNGDICDLTGKPRQVEVKLKCVLNPSQPHAVSLYLIEPKSCDYILGIESHILCSLMDEVDEAGIIPK